MALNIRKLLEGMIKVGASDLHLKVGQKPTIRLHGVLRPIEHPELTASDTESANAEMMPDRCEDRMRKFGSVDYSFGLTPTERFRVNAYHQRGFISLALRTITSKTLTFEDLNLPAILETIANYRTGMVLVTGITGSGKSSTLAALVTWINKSRREHIITIEDPIEYLFQDDKCIIDQIEVGSDVSDFKVALRHSLRQDPDVILIGEMRDRETIEVALHCVETGHLVLSTLHTPDAKQTILRLLHFFPPADHHLLTEQLSMNLRAVICQRLLKTADGQGRVPCCEIMIGSPIVQKLIRENRFDELEQVLANGEEGMQSFDSHLVQLIKGDLITLEEALNVARDEAAMKRELAGRSAGADRRGLVG